MKSSKSPKSEAEKTETSRRATDPVRAETPKQGETYRCEQCGMELEITQDCACSDPAMVHLECCGQEMAHGAV